MVGEIPAETEVGESGGEVLALLGYGMPWDAEGVGDVKNRVEII